MTKHKRGQDHWTAEVKAERDKLRELLIEIYAMTEDYYCNIQDIQRKIKQSGVLE